MEYPDISTPVVSDEAAAVVQPGADTVPAGDMGCLLNIAGRLNRQGGPVRVRHGAEVPAGTTGEVPPIGEGRGGAAPPAGAAVGDGVTVRGAAQISSGQVTASDPVVYARARPGRAHCHTRGTP